MSGRKRRSADTQDERETSAMTQLLKEALDRVASPEARDSVIFMALADGGLAAIPDDLVMFRRFALGPLRRAMELTLSGDMADAVLSDLTPLIERAASTITGAARTQSSGSFQLGLVIGSANSARANAWIAAAPSGTVCRVANDMFDLVAGIDVLRECDLSLVIDGSMAMMDQGALSTLLRVLPPTADVVLLGFQDDGSMPDAWHRLSHDATDEEIIATAFPDAGESRSDEIDLEAGDESANAMRVLVIDEDARLRGAIVNHLRTIGMDVTTATDAFRGLEIASDDRPDVIIVDDALEKVDGERFCELVERIMGADRPAVIVMVDAKARRIAGADGVFVKGGDNALLAEAVIAARRGWGP